MQLTRFILGMLLIGATIFQIAFDRPIDDSWTRANTGWFIRYMISGITGIFLIVTSTV